MSGSAARRVEAIGKQLAAPDGAAEGIAAIKKVAADSSSPRVKDKVIIITGANSVLGIGRAAAHQFAENGAKAVYLCDFDDRYLETHKKEIKASWPDVEVHTRKFDAADEKAVEDVIADALQRYARLDVFFANAGVTGAHDIFTNIDADDVMETLRVNTLSVFLAAKHGAKAMMKTSPGKEKPSGSIIMTASVAGIRSNAGSTPYSASKAAVISIAQTTAYQLAGTGIRANAICPGIIETGMTAPVFERARSRGTEGKIGQLNPLRRGGHADEVARVALFLGSDESSYVTGQAWAVDGGLSAGHPYVLGKLA